LTLAPPAPPRDLHSRPLSLRILPAQSRLSRIHDAAHAAVWFGPLPGTPPRNRFDAPAGEFRVCYLALTPQAAFAETFLRNPGRRLLEASTVEQRALAELVTTHPLSLVCLYGPEMARLRATAEVTHGPDYANARAWAAALWNHPLSPDGILYKSRHDDDEVCLALFDRGEALLEVVSTEPLLRSRWLMPLLSRYRLGLNEDR
jgi:hypothetical protein